MMQLESMDITKESVSNWLNTHHRTRDWLADKCQVSRRTVDNWLVSPRPIPSKAHPIIATLMQADEDKARICTSIPQNLVLEFSREDFATICQRASTEQQGPNEWAEEQLRQLAYEDMDELEQRLKVAEDPAPYNEPPKPNDDAGQTG